MEFHRGRLLDHVHPPLADLAASRGLHLAVLAVLGREPSFETPEAFVADEPFLTSRLPEDGQATGRAYHPGYYSAYLHDPDRNDVEALHRGPVERSAASVVVRPAS